MRETERSHQRTHRLRDGSESTELILGAGVSWRRQVHSKILLCGAGTSETLGDS